MTICGISRAARSPLVAPPRMPESSGFAPPRGAMRVSLRLLSVDAATSAGWALWTVYARVAVLAQCGVDRPPYHVLRSIKPDTLIIERPNAGDRRSTRKDLITLAAQFGDVRRAIDCPDTREFEAQAWKGSVPKNIMCERVYENWMNDNDRAVVERLGRISKKALYDVLDGIGLGIWFLRKEGLR